MARPFANKSQQSANTIKKELEAQIVEKQHSSNKWQVTQFCIINTISKGQVEYLPEQFLDVEDVTKETLEFLQQLEYVKRV